MEKDVHTTYDSLGRITSKRFVSTSGKGVSYGYDSLGRITSTTDINGRPLAYAYNTASAVTSVTYPDSYVFTRSLDNLNRVTQVYNGSTVFFSQAFTSQGLRKKLLRGAAIASGERTDAACVNQTNATCYSYDAFGRLTSMGHDLTLTGNDITWSFTGRNPANQITSWDASSINYDYDEQQTATENRTYDGLNRDSGIAALTGGYDANGNLANESASAADKRCMTYDVLNRLSTVAWCNAKASPILKLYYDPEGRLAAYTANGTTNEFTYDGVNLIAEYTYSGAYNIEAGSETMTKRYVHGTGVDEPLVWYAGPAVTSPNFLLANYQGSIIGYSSDTGALTELYRYDPYGRPTNSANSKFWNGSRFRYTGQYAIPEAELYYYKARVYDPNYGRFLQTDPIGSKDDLNLYAYVAGDPINATDPTGNDGVYCNVKPETKEIECSYWDDDRKKTYLSFYLNGKKVSETVEFDGEYTKDADVQAEVDSFIDLVGTSILGKHVTLNDCKPIITCKKYQSDQGFNNKQRNGRPKGNTVQNRKVTDAANQAKLNDSQRERMGRIVEENSRKYGHDYTYEELLDLLWI